MALTKYLWQKVGLYLDLDDLTNYCLVTKRTNSFCDQAYFKSYFEHNIPFISQTQPENVTISEWFLGILKLNWKDIRSLWINSKQDLTSAARSEAFWKKYFEGKQRLIVETKPPNISYITWFEKLQNNWVINEDWGINKSDLFQFALNHRIRSIIKEMAPARQYQTNLNFALNNGILTDDLDYFELLLESGAQFYTDNLERIFDEYDKLSLLIKYHQISDDGFRRLLTRVARDNNKNLLAFILQQGLNINAFHGFLLGETIRQAVVFGGYTDFIQHLINKGANIVDDNAIGFVARNGNLPIIKFLVAHGIRLNTRDDRTLKAAVLSGDLDVVKYLVSQGFEIGPISLSLVRFAVGIGKQSLIQYIIDNSNDIEAAKNEAISIPSSKPIVEFLIQTYNYDKNILNSISKTAKVRGDEELVTLLVEHGANYPQSEDPGF